MGLEKSFQSALLEYLNSIPGCAAENVSGNAAQSGRADINGCYKGRTFRFELKSPDHKNTASKKQLLNMRRWLNAGAVVGTFYSMSAVKELFREDWSKPLYKVFLEANGCASSFKIPSTK